MNDTQQKQLGLTLWAIADKPVSYTHLDVYKRQVLVASEQKMMIMRPYQIYAVKAIMDCIEQNRCV